MSADSFSNFHAVNLPSQHFPSPFSYNKQTKYSSTVIFPCIYIHFNLVLLIKIKQSDGYSGWHYFVDFFTLGDWK